MASSEDAPLASVPSKCSRFDDKKARQYQYAGACSYRQSAYTLREDALTSTSEDRRQFVRWNHLELGEGAVHWTFVVTPAAKLCGVSKALPLHVVVGNLG